MKSVIGFAKPKKELSKVAWDGNSEVYGDDSLQVWKRAFENLGKVDSADRQFDENFFWDIKSKVAVVLDDSELERETDSELAKNIREEEVVECINKLSSRTGPVSD